MKNKLRYLVLSLVVFLAVFVYFWRLDGFPKGFYIDEALVGYSAYSLLLTGKDEWGMRWPMFLRFFGSYNPPIYTYLTISSIKMFGLNVFAVRFWSAVSGVVSILGICWLYGILWPKKYWGGIFAALFLTISPWAMLYARTGYEVHLAMSLLTLGLGCLYLGLENSRWWYGASILLSLSMYTAYAERIFVPIFLVGFFVIYRNKILKKVREVHFVGSLVIGVFLQLPHLLLLFTPAFLPKESLKVIDMSLIEWVREVMSLYVGYFSPSSLFFWGDPDLQRSIPEIAVFLPWMVVPYFLGLWSLWRSKIDDAIKFLLLMLVVFPIPAALTRDPFSSHRAFALVIPMILVLSFGLCWLQGKLNKYLFWSGLLGVVIFSLLLLWRSWFVLMPERASYWMIGYERLAAVMNENRSQKYLIDQERVKPGYINLAFFLKIPPEIFQSHVDQSIKDNYYYRLGFDPRMDFGWYRLGSIDWEQDIYVEQVLVGDSLAISEDQAREHSLGKVFEIKDDLGEILFVGWKTDPVAKCKKVPVSKDDDPCHRIRL